MKTTTSRADAFDRAAALEVIATRPGGDKLMDLTFLHAIAAPKRKRALSLHNDNDSDDTAGTATEDVVVAEDSTSGDGSSDATDSPHTPVPTSQQQHQQQLKKQRKPTHVLRRVRRRYGGLASALSLHLNSRDHDSALTDWIDRLVLRCCRKQKQSY